MINDFISTISDPQRATTRDSFWPEMAASLALANALLLMEAGTREEANVGSFGTLCSSVSEEALQSLSKRMSEKTVAGLNYKGVFVSADNTRKSIFVSLYSMVRIFNTQKNLTKMLSGNSVDLRNIGREKTAIYVIIPDEKTTYHFLATTFLKQVYEILIGDTNRYSTANGKIMQYSVTIKDGKFRINTGGLFSLDKAMEYITSSILNGTARTLSEGEYYSTSLITTKQAITSGTTARIMTTNALADAFNTDSKYKTAAYRVEIYAGILISHTPDAIGAQELDNAWNNVLDKYLDKVYNETGIRYARQYAKYENKINYTSLIYRSDKYSVGDSGVTVFTWWKNSTINHGYHMRNVTWAQFVSKTNTSKKFILATTHWSYTTEHEDTYGYNTLRVQCKNETNSLLTTLKNKYSMPIFLMGDLNTSLSYFTYYGWLNSSYNVLSSQATSNNTLITKLPTENHFDHILGTGSYTIKRYDYLTSTNYKNNLSDHPFFYADVAF
jgi:endonuclease/exonuclease/phosphatase family metal-dependent hydrolase